MWFCFLTLHLEIPYMVIKQMPGDFVTTKIGTLHVVFTEVLQNATFTPTMKFFLLFLQSSLTLAFAFNMQAECTPEYFKAVQINYERLLNSGVTPTIPWITPICVFATDPEYVVLYSLFPSVHFCFVVLTLFCSMQY